LLLSGQNTFNFLFPLCAPLPQAGIVGDGHPITLEIEMADHDTPFAQYSSTFRQLISRKGRPMYFPSLPALVKTLQIAQSFIFENNL